MSDTIKSQVRYPRALHAALTKLAAANHRSINAEVVMAIEGHVAVQRGRTFVSGHSDDCPSARGGKCAYPCYMQTTDRSAKRAKGTRK